MTEICDPSLRLICLYYSISGIGSLFSGFYFIQVLLVAGTCSLFTVGMDISEIQSFSGCTHLSINLNF